MTSIVRHVVYTTDENYWMQVYVSIFSLLSNNPDARFHFWILSETRNDLFFDNTRILERSHGKVEFSFLPVDAELFSNSPLSYAYFTRAVYYRLTMGQLLPADVRRVLFIDGDTLVRGSLDGLFDTDVDEHVLAAVPDLEAGHAARVRLPSGSEYFNAGVLLINLDRWRAEGVERACAAYIDNNRDHAQRVLLQDQDALNVVLAGKWRALSAEFNFIEWQRPGASFEPKIVHFAGWAKPWEYTSHPGYKKEYWGYLKRTPYAGYRPPDRTPRTVIRRSVGEALRKLPGGDGLIRSLRSRRP